MQNRKKLPTLETKSAYLSINPGYAPDYKYSVLYIRKQKKRNELGKPQKCGFLVLK